MDAVVNGPVPQCRSSNLRWTAVSFNYKKVPSLQAEALQFAWEKLDVMYFSQV